MPFANKSKANLNLAKGLTAWSEWHALAIGLGVFGFLIGLPQMALTMVAILSFSAFLFQFRKCWTPSGQFGAANLVTLFRLVGVLLLFSMVNLDYDWIALIPLCLFALDAVDGWVARRLGIASEFGEYFDKEVDAFFLLVLCLVLYADHRIGTWVLIPGLLRYLFVAYLKIVKPPQMREHRTGFGRWVFFLVMLSMILAFTAWKTIYIPFVALTTFLLCLSFADSIRRFHWHSRILETH